MVTMVPANATKIPETLPIPGSMAAASARGAVELCSASKGIIPVITTDSSAYSTIMNSTEPISALGMVFLGSLISPVM